MKISLSYHEKKFARLRIYMTLPDRENSGEITLTAHVRFRPLIGAGEQQSRLTQTAEKCSTGDPGTAEQARTRGSSTSTQHRTRLVLPLKLMRPYSEKELRCSDHTHTHTHRNEVTHPILGLVIDAPST